MDNRSVVHILERRKTEICAARSNALLPSAIAFTTINLDDIMDVDRALVNGHIILGFTRDGQHLISYQCRVDALHTYSLHWWRFNLRSPLRHVHYEELFRGEKIEQDLHLIVCQTPDDGSVVVLGSTLGLAEDDCRSCYISVLPSCNPEDTTRKPSSTFHIKYELLPPYPPFSPSLSLSLTGSIILNTGDTLVAICYAADMCQRSSLSTCSVHTHQLFVGPSDDITMSPGCVVSPSQLLLPVEVYCGDQHWMLTSRKQKGHIEVCQTTLDIELWLSNLFHTELGKRGVVFNSVNDYDMQLAEVSPSGCVLFVVAVVLEACTPPSCLAECLTTVVVATWDVNTGQVCCIEFEELKEAHPAHKRRGSTSSLALELRKMWHTPISVWTSVRAFSNHTVFTGKSLRSLSHPILPLAVVFSHS